MSLRRKRKDEEDHVSDENEGHVPPKKASKTSAAADSDNSNDIVIFEWNILQDHVEEIDKALAENS